MIPRKHFLFFIAFLFFVAPSTAFAAAISFQMTPARIGVGDTVRMDVLLNSAIAVNAFSGTFVYPKTLEPIAISDGNSIVNMWITRPILSSPDGKITFAGITPGGFSGNAGMLFSILFRAKTSGTASVSLENVEVLRNDGIGSKEPVTVKQRALSVLSKSSGGYTEPVDTTPPEPFTAYLDNDPALFGGHSYLVFTTVDKGSGIDRYAVAESRMPMFLSFLSPFVWETTAVSPFVLADQNLTSAIYIKAVDRAGNERLSTYPPRHLLTVYEKVVFLVILMGVILLFLQRGRERWMKDL